MGRNRKETVADEALSSQPSPSPAVDQPFALECFSMMPDPPRLVPARTDRLWMDRVFGRHAYRCLPMTIANTYGWEVLSPCDFEILWTGGLNLPDLRFRTEYDPARFGRFAESNFGHGIATFHPGYLFRTPPGWQIFASGPLNESKHGAVALTGVIETDWLPYPFTMNWKLTRPGVVTFAKDEPFCMLFPVRAGDIELFTPVIRNIDEDPEFKRQHEAWRDSRAEFRNRQKETGSLSARAAWQKFYFKGEGPDGKAVPIAHQQRLRASRPVDRRRPPGDPEEPVG